MCISSLSVDEAPLLVEDVSLLAEEMSLLVEEASLLVEEVSLLVEEVSLLVEEVSLLVEYSPDLPEAASCAAVLPPEYPCSLIFPGNLGCPLEGASAYLAPPGPEGEYSSSFREEASLEGPRVVALEVSSLANVELAPFTANGSESRFSENPPPARVDSAARESEATGPAPSRSSFLARGSVVF